MNDRIVRTLRLPPPVWMILAGAAMWALHRWLPVATFIALPWNRIGWVIVAAGVATSITASTQFRRAGTTLNPWDPSKSTQLVTNGIFAFSRNPMYLGLILVLAGWAMWLGSLSPWLMLPLLIVLLTRRQILPEERALRELFGEGYAQYCRTVGRWLGRKTQ